MAEAPLATEETTHPCTDVEEWKKKVLEKFGEEDYNLMPANDLLRTIRGYYDDKEREKLTMEGVRLFVEELKDRNFANLGFTPVPETEFYQNLRKNMLFTSFGQDKQGHPIMFENIEKYNVPELSKAFGENPDACIEYRLRVYSQAWNKKHQEAKKRGVIMYKHVNIFNMNNVGLMSVKSILDILKKFMKKEGDLFPETVYKMYIINTGWTFKMIWKIVSLFVHENTIAKIKILGGKSDYLPKMLEEIDEDQIPESLGGTNKTPINWGGVWYRDGVDPQFPAADAAPTEG